MELDEPMSAPESPASNTERPGIVELAFSGGTFKRSLQTGLVVGTILSAINPGDVIVAGEAPSFIKIALNYLVPYFHTARKNISTESNLADFGDAISRY